MSKWFVVALAAALLIGSGLVAWALRHRLTDAPSSAPTTEYSTFVDRCGGNEALVRFDLNRITLVGTCGYSATDATKVASLQSECTNPNELLAIERVSRFVQATNQGEVRPFEFLSPAQAQRLKAIVGEQPSAARVTVMRSKLVQLSTTFAEIRKPPDWNVNIEGDRPPMPFLDLLRAAHDFMPVGGHPRLVEQPQVPTFSAMEAELLEHLERYFNTPQMRSAFPPDRFPKLYVNDRVPALPAALGDYREAILRGINQEKAILLPGKTPDPEQAEAIDEIFQRLIQMFDVTVATIK